MTAQYQEIADLLDSIKRLPPEYRVQLMHGILDTLVPEHSGEKSKILQFGEFKDFDGPLSTYEDYALAEWRPSERDLDGK